MTNELATETFPFGKHKGCSIAEVMATDPQYLEWIAAQDWFAQKYRPIYNIIVNAAPTQVDTPEHNKLQALFLDDDFCRRFLRRVCPDYFGPCKKVRNCGTDLGINAGSACYIPDSKMRISLIEKVSREMESVADVRLYSRYQIEYDYRAYKDGDTSGPSGDVQHSKQQFIHPWNVEIKGMLGDDYPSVLRQIKGQRDKRVLLRGESHMPYRDDGFVLLYDSFTASGATEAQVRQIFKESGIAAVRLDEVPSGADLGEGGAGHG